MSADDAVRARIRALAERPLTREEFEAALGVPDSPEEREAKRDLIRWFIQRYPTPAARFAYARRATKRHWRP